MSEVELLRIGAGHCLFQPATHSLALLNDAAAGLWRRRFEEPPISADDIHMIEAWRSAGFFVTDNVPVDQTTPVPKRKVAPPANQTLYCYHKVALMVEDDHLRNLLAAVLSPLLTPGDGSVGIEVRDDTSGGYDIALDGEPLAWCDNISDARRLTLQAILLGLHGVQNVSALLHASAVEVAGRALLIAGPTEAGKSTLTVALVASGARYLGDDLMALGPDGSCVGTFPIATSIKSGSLDIVRGLFPEVDQAAIHEMGERRVRYLDLAGPSNATVCSLPVSAIVFPSYTPGTKSKVDALTPEEAFVSLIESGTEIVGRPRSAKPLAHLANAHRAWQMTYGSLDAAVQTAGELARLG